MVTTVVSVDLNNL